MTDNFKKTMFLATDQCKIELIKQLETNFHPSREKVDFIRSSKIRVKRIIKRLPQSRKLNCSKFLAKLDNHVKNNWTTLQFLTELKQSLTLITFDVPLRSTKLREDDTFRLHLVRELQAAGRKAITVQFQRSGDCVVKGSEEGFIYGVIDELAKIGLDVTITESHICNPAKYRRSFTSPYSSFIEGLNDRFGDTKLSFESGSDKSMVNDYDDLFFFVTALNCIQINK